jgi:hypothetical protein
MGALTDRITSRMSRAQSVVRLGGEGGLATMRTSRAVTVSLTVLLMTAATSPVVLAHSAEAGFDDTGL